MEDRTQLQATIDELEQLHLSLGEIVRQARDGWRLELVQRRRALSDILGRVATLLNGLDKEQVLPSADRLVLRNKLTTFRSALAMHQASYPAVSITQDDKDYRDSAQRVQTASTAFCNQIRRLLNLR